MIAMAPDDNAGAGTTPAGPRRGRRVRAKVA
jgi:hypothetical protein